MLGRSDVLQWSAPQAFTNATAVVGKITATIVVSSSAVDTDFYVTLTDQYPNGEQKKNQPSFYCVCVYIRTFYLLT
jgi:predicted acyl esterase